MGIAVMAPDQMSPMTVEATSDGWVVVTPFWEWREDRDALPAARLLIAPQEVQAWLTAVHRLGASSADSVTPQPALPIPGDTLPMLGRGRVHVGPQFRRWRGDITLDFSSCDGGNMGLGMTPSSFDRFTGALERAMNVARRGDAPPRPTLARPYYRTEVSCAARPVQASVAPSFPATIPPAERRYTEVGLRFIVDTAGFIESGSLAVLPGTPAAFAKAAEAVVRGWRYRAAELRGFPVRQIVTTVIAFDPADIATRNDPDRIASARRMSGGDMFQSVPQPPPLYVLRDGGWVRVAMGHWRPNGMFDGFQEWMAPDSVDAWVAHASQLLAADSAQPKFPRSTFERGKGPGFPLYPAQTSSSTPSSGNSLRVQYENGWHSDTQRLKLVASMAGCGNGSSMPATEIDRRLLERLTTAARAARRHHKAEPSPERTYRRGEEACPAFLPYTSSGRAGLAGLWHYPRAPYPAALSSKHVRAEVLTSFDVDPMGTPIAATLKAAPGSDPRAVAALRQTIGHVRFNPAARAGSKVRSHVIRTWLFEPPAVCAGEDDGIDCAREYGRSP